MLLISGILILMAILFALREIEIPIFSQLGQWFVSRFLLASFYIPAYLIFCAVYLLMPRFNLKVMLTLMTTLIPFLTLVPLLRVLLWTSGIRYLIAVLLVIALVAEVYGIAVFAGLKWRPSFKFNLKSDDDTDEDDIAEKVAEESEEALGDVSDADSDVPAYLSMGFKRISETRERGHFADDDKELVPPDDNVDVKIAEPEDAEPEEPEEPEKPLFTGKPRYVWIDASANFRYYANDKDAIASDLKKIKAVGFTDVIVDVRPTEGSVLFNSKVSPQVRRLAAWVDGKYKFVNRTADFDYLQTFIDAGHEAGLRVNAAMNTFVCGYGGYYGLESEGPIFSKHSRRMGYRCKREGRA